MTLLVCYELGRTLFGKTTGLLASLVVTSTPMMIASAHFANPDAVLHLLIVLTMFLFWQSQRGGGGWWYAAMGATSGTAVLAKGPVGLILPAAIAVCHCLWTRRRLLGARRGLRWASLTFTLIAVPWYVLVAVETKGRFLEEFLLKHNVSRFLKTANFHDGSFYYHPIAMILGTIPWSIFLGPAFWYAFVRKPSPGEPSPGEPSLLSGQVAPITHRGNPAA